MSQVIIDKVDMNCSNPGSQEEEKGGKRRRYAGNDHDAGALAFA